jgi:predicted ATPase
MSTEEQITALELELERIDPLFARRAPILGPALNLPIPDNDLTQNLDAKLRKESLETLVADCIHFYSNQVPLLIVLEDCHWIDPLSLDLLETVERRIADLPIMILKICRPSMAPKKSGADQQLAYFHEIHLTEFTPEETRLLIEAKLAYLYKQEYSVPDRFVQQITTRAQGNPFYIDEIVNLLHDRGLEIADLQSLETFELPDSLHSLIISRIDQLTENAKTTLKVASVIGRSFQARWLWGIYPKLGTPKQVIEQLQELSKLDITPLDTPGPELEYLFKHILTRDVAYESLTLATRSRLHELIAAYIENYLYNKRRIIFYK